jgi:hypothetical protein
LFLETIFELKPDEVMSLEEFRYWDQFFNYDDFELQYWIEEDYAEDFEITKETA